MFQRGRCALCARATSYSLIGLKFGKPTELERFQEVVSNLSVTMACHHGRICFIVGRNHDEMYCVIIFPPALRPANCGTCHASRGLGSIPPNSSGGWG